MWRGKQAPVRQGLAWRRVAWGLLMGRGAPLPPLSAAALPKGARGAGEGAVCRRSALRQPAAAAAAAGRRTALRGVWSTPGTPAAPGSGVGRGRPTAPKALPLPLLWLPPPLRLLEPVPDCYGSGPRAPVKTASTTHLPSSSSSASLAASLAPLPLPITPLAYPPQPQPCAGAAQALRKGQRARGSVGAHRGVHRRRGIPPPHPLGWRAVSL